MTGRFRLLLNQSEHRDALPKTGSSRLRGFLEGLWPVAHINASRSSCKLKNHLLKRPDLSTPVWKGLRHRARRLLIVENQTLLRSINELLAFFDLI